jgi:hypothetical protein
VVSSGTASLRRCLLVTDPISGVSYLVTQTCAMWSTRRTEHAQDSRQRKVVSSGTALLRRCLLVTDLWRFVSCDADECNVNAYVHATSGVVTLDLCQDGHPRPPRSVFKRTESCGPELLSRGWARPFSRLLSCGPNLLSCGLGLNVADRVPSGHECGRDCLDVNAAEPANWRLVSLDHRDCGRVRLGVNTWSSLPGCADRRECDAESVWT